MSICRIVFILIFACGLLAGDVVYTAEVPAPSVVTTDAQGNAFTARVPPGPSKPGQDIVVTKRVGDARRSDNAFWPRTWTRQPTPFQVNSAGLVSTSLAGTRVFFDDAEAPLLYVQEGQINVVAPYTLPARKKPRYKSSFKVNGRMLSRYQSATRIHPSSEASQPCFRYSSRKTEV